jgi:hypothetical protein
MKRFIVTLSACLTMAGCATQPSQSEIELAAYRNVLKEQYQKGKVTAAEAQLAEAQYAGGLKMRESNINAANGFAQSQAAYAQNSGILTGMALYCAGQRGGRC